MGSIESRASVASSEAAVRDLRVNSQEFLPTAIHFAGAQMLVVALNTDWPDPRHLIAARGATGTCLDLATVALPTREQVRASLWATDEEMSAIRNMSQYGCHDLRVIKRLPSGEIVYYASRREEPGANSNLSARISADAIEHTAAINGCWWAVGGRIAVPRAGSELESMGFSVVHSALMRLNAETGIQPEQVLAMRTLGVGLTNFPERMLYTYRMRTPSGEAVTFELPVRMNPPQHTMNLNLVIEVDLDTLITPRTLGSGVWIDRSDYLGMREQYCSYEIQFLDALFAASNDKV